MFWWLDSQYRFSPTIGTSCVGAIVNRIKIAPLAVAAKTLGGRIQLDLTARWVPAMV